jgi:tubulin polyglutamylase TTLL1
VKPNNKSQGQGIFLLKRMQQLKKITNGASPNFSFKNLNSSEVFIISKYVENPLLIGGKKFDLRIYVLVTSYRPLKVYLYDEGFARFCNEQYSSDITEMDNMFVHLTNVAIQKFSDKYSDKHGGKWPIRSLRFYIESVFGTEKCNRCF